MSEGYLPRILIIDDDTTSLAAMHQKLKARYRVSLFVGGAGAVEVIRKIGPDLVIVDRQMPGLSGLEICRWLKSPEAKMNIPVIVYSAALDHDQFEHEAASAGADLAVMKSIHVDALTRAIDSLTGGGE